MADNGIEKCESEKVKKLYNPCRHCRNSTKYKNKHYPSMMNSDCKNCDLRKAYMKYRESQKMYVPGDYIRSIEELLEHDWIMLYESPKHISIIQNMILRTVLAFISRKAIRVAVKKGDTNERKCRTEGIESSSKET